MRVYSYPYKAVFNSPYDQYRHRNGQTVTITGRVPPETYDSEECGPMYNGQFADGERIQLWPEEIEERLQDTATVPASTLTV